MNSALTACKTPNTFSSILKITSTERQPVQCLDLLACNHLWHVGATNLTHSAVGQYATPVLLSLSGQWHACMHKS